MALICEGRSTFSMERVDMLSANGLCKVEGSFHENLAVVGLGAVGEGFASPRGGLSFVGPQKKLCSADSIFGDRESPKTNGDADNVSTIALDNAGAVDEGFASPRGSSSFVGPQKKIRSADSLFGVLEPPKTNGDADNVSTITLDDAGAIVPLDSVLPCKALTVPSITSSPCSCSSSGAAIPSINACIILS